jgi:hypothetical protein
VNFLHIKRKYSEVYSVDELATNDIHILVSVR